MSSFEQDLADVPVFVPQGPKQLVAGLYLAYVKKAQVQVLKGVKKLVVTYEALWSPDEALHNVIGHRITDFIDLTIDIGLERVNSLRIAIGKPDCKASKEFENGHVMLVAKQNQKNANYVNVSYVYAPKDDVIVAYNEYVAKHNAEMEAKHKAEGYDPDIGF